jgi:hypothetical protein
MVYFCYNLRLWVRQIQKTPEVDTISLDGIDTTTAWRVETERPILESMSDWLQEEVEGAVAEEREVEEEDVLEQSQQTPLKEVTIDTRSVPMLPSSCTLVEGVVLGSSTGRGHQSLAHASSIGHQSPTPTLGPSSSKGKTISRIITFARKRGRENH